MRKEKLFASQGGPIILAQIEIENEYGNVMSKYGDAGKAYLDWCANLAHSNQIRIPWLVTHINTCNSWYCDQFTPTNPNTPKMWTGWFKSWGGAIPHRTAEDVAFAVARFFQTGGTFQNYYMTRQQMLQSHSKEVVPAWFVSIIPDCKNEVYNTAKVNAQTSSMAKKSNEAEEEPASLSVNDTFKPSLRYTMCGCKRDILMLIGWHDLVKTCFVALLFVA
ncbi:hypothetical protein Dsin_030626 [Dipteronia sinensis]|uniref:beta-galactosidase n=1 Tax=Dipteronia sinensis TaxID=43782 RepID=A0AAD9ZJZ7_9ROSI|nr:hypothetical protein Dsin_030626 [Dipteronia sinensis]